MADGSTMLTRLLKGVWRDTATVTLGLVLMFTLAAMDGHERAILISGLPFHVDEHVADLVVNGILARAVVAMLPSIAIISLAVRLIWLAILGILRLEQRWLRLPDDFAGDTPAGLWLALMGASVVAVPGVLLLGFSLVGGFRMLHGWQQWGNAAFCLTIIGVIAWKGGRHIARCIHTTRAFIQVRREANV